MSWLSRKKEEKDIESVETAIAVQEKAVAVVEDKKSEDDLFGMDEVDTSVSVIKSLGTVDKSNMPMKAILKNPTACVSVCLKAEYADVLGLPKTAKFRRLFMEAHYSHSVGLKGKRAEQMFEALNIEVQKDFEIAKKSAMRGALP